MSTTDSQATTLAREHFDAYTTGRPVPELPSTRIAGFDVAAAYAVDAELMRLRRADGHVTVGRKVAFANKAMWRALKLQTLVWAHMYDDTVRYAKNGRCTLPLARMRAPRIEPELVLKLRSVPAAHDAGAVLESVEWLALGFEIVDCPYPGWTFQPADLLASLGFHAALVVGEPRAVQHEDVASLVEALGAFTVRLQKNGEVVEEGAGKNSLRSPALCVAELASAIAAQPGAEPLRSGELISTGSLTAAHPIAAGESWTLDADGLDVPSLAVDLRS